MTDAIVLNATRYASPPSEPGIKGSGQEVAAGLRPVAPVQTAMDDEIVRLLTDAIAGQLLVGPKTGDGRTSAASPVVLRAPTISLDDASTRLTGIVGKLQQVLSALIGSQDPTQHEEGATVRAAEGAAAQGAARTVMDGPVIASSPEGVTGADADMRERSANAGAWIVSSPFSGLLALLRQLLLKFEKLDRDNSAQMVTMQREITIIAGEKGVEKARENLGGAIGSAVLTGAIGGAALKQTFKSTSMQTGSLKNNQGVGNNASVSDAKVSGGIKASGTPSDQLRSARNVDGSSVPAQKGGALADADIQPDLAADGRAINHSAKQGSHGTAPEPLNQGHGASMAHAQIPASQAMMLNMLAPGIGGTISAGVQIEAEMTEAERQLLLQVADVFRRIADEQQDQSARSREMRDAAAQLYESLLNLISSTSAHIISKS
ncbi:hypothetical protein [Stenotrophomonas sp. AB1(2024)]|uniref:hypothetical protein n=1 Tax=Stenotrophomonas sp. AB1(2024) TaxID=3132215 RepID=UPI003099C3F4